MTIHTTPRGGPRLPSSETESRARSTPAGLRWRRTVPSSATLSSGRRRTRAGAALAAIDEAQRALGVTCLADAVEKRR